MIAIKGIECDQGLFIQLGDKVRVLESRDWRSLSGKGSARHFRCFAVLGGR